MIEPVVAALLTRLAAEQASALLKYIYVQFVDQRQNLPSKIASPEDVGKVVEVLVNEKERLGEAATESVSVGAIEAAHSHLEGIRSERLRQARTSFNTAVVLVVIGALIIFAGVVLMYLDKTTAGVVSAAVGLVIEIISVVLFRFNRETNDRLDKLTPDLIRLERARYGMKYIERIETRKSREQAIDELAKDLATSHKTVEAEQAAAFDPARDGSF